MRRAIVTGCLEVGRLVIERIIRVDVLLEFNGQQLGELVSPTIRWSIFDSVDATVWPLLGRTSSIGLCVCSDSAIFLRAELPLVKTFELEPQ